ncbi:TonB-like protein [Chitinophaga dinghuensis]|uniref:TonB-like protein n=1 Tax=Chitinophaga dinghuensis TaxID=1539050 RepID=A0A327W763_9BACT|nr:hypothetical protein [Chitinophaga dinghuensis]RAJ81858.1 TonB-like protein [Chitinophaga dinghuensis]
MKTERESRSQEHIKLLMIISGLLFSIIASAQKSARSNQCENTYDSLMKAKVTTLPEVPPVFPGGEQALNIYLMRNIHYKMEDDYWQGSFQLAYIINAHGVVCYTRILNKRPEEYTIMEKEVLRVLNAMPAWTPGKCNGKKVNVKMFMPLRICPQE